MTREEISNSVVSMLLNDNIEPMASPVECYNYWAQKNQIRITDPEIASWTLGLIKKLLATDKKFLTNFIQN